jgi:hypothetical protein
MTWVMVVQEKNKARHLDPSTNQSKYVLVVLAPNSTRCTARQFSCKDNNVGWD